MEKRAETINLIEYLKQGFREIIDNINGKKEETELAKMSGISQETLKILTDSLARIDENAEKFSRQQGNEDIGKKRQKPENLTKKEIGISQYPNPNPNEARQEKRQEIEHEEK